MNDKERVLLQYVCDGDIRMAQQQAKIILNEITTQKDGNLKKHLLNKLEAKGPEFIELPYNLRDLLIAEDCTDFPKSRFILRKDEKRAVDEVLSLYRVADRLSEIGISYLPALMLYGQSGCGKTMLARYIAHKAGLPFVYVRFSSLVNQYLGGTQSNIGKVFEYARTAPCVLCFDEIDAIGMARGQANDVGEMNRIVIALMQEMDRLHNHVIIVGTTNRFDRLDPALVRRFPIQYEVSPLSMEDARKMAEKFFSFADVGRDSGWMGKWCEDNLTDQMPASTVVKRCTDAIVQILVSETGRGGNTGELGN